MCNAEDPLNFNPLDAKWDDLSADPMQHLHAEVFGAAAVHIFMIVNYVHTTLLVMLTDARNIETQKDKKLMYMYTVGHS